MTGNPLADIGNLIIGTLASLYLAVIMLRFLFQLVRADFYNPISQFVVKATNPLLIPLRKVIPGLFGIDFAAVVLALIFHSAVIFVLGFINGTGLLPLPYVLAWALIGCLSLVANIFFWGILVSIIVSWVAPYSGNPALLLLRQLTEPAMAPFRRLLPPMGGLDLSPILTFLALQVAMVLINYLGVITHLPTKLVIGI